MKHAFVWAMPQLNVRYTPDDKVKTQLNKKKKSGGRPKYDHEKMIEDRISGMTWSQVATKHGITGSNRGHRARMAVQNSQVFRNLKPERAAKLSMGS